MSHSNFSKRLLPALLALSGYLVLTGCEPTANEDTVSQGNISSEAKVAGSLTQNLFNGSNGASESIGKTASLSQLLQMTKPGLPALEGKALGKKSNRMADETGLTFDLTDTASGFVRVYFSKVTGGIEEYDSAKVLWDEYSKDEISDNENIIEFRGLKVAPNKLESFSITDADGDGVAGGQAKYNKRVKLFSSSTFLQADEEHRVGDREVAEIVVDAGLDQNFDAEDDNEIVSLSWKRYNTAGELVAQANAIDLDGDGIVYSNKMGSQVMMQLENYDDPKPDIVSGKLFFTVTKDEGGKDIMTGFSGEEIQIDGRHNRFYALNSKNDSILVPGENFFVHMLSSSVNETDTVEEAHLIIAVNPGSDWSSDSDNRVTEMHFVGSNRLGPIAAFQIDFYPSEPFLFEHEPKGGSLNADFSLRDGGSATLQGSYSKDGDLDLTYTGPDGSKTRLTVKKGESL